MVRVLSTGQITVRGGVAAEAEGQVGGGGGRGILHSFLRYARQSIGRGVSSTAPQTRCISTCSVHSYSSFPSSCSGTLRDWQRRDRGEETRGRVARTAYHRCGVSVHGVGVGVGVGVDTEAGAGGGGVGASAGTGAGAGAGGAREMGAIGARLDDPIDPMESSCMCSTIPCDCGCSWSSMSPESSATAVAIAVGGGANANKSR